MPSAYFTDNKAEGNRFFRNVTFPPNYKPSHTKKQ